MDFLNVLGAISKPSGMWESIIFGMGKGIANYALTIILITILIKIVFLPFDFMNRYMTKNTTAKQAEMAPELAKAQKKYGHNKELLNQKTMEIYKQHNFKMGGSCVGMLVYMVATMVVFFTLFTGLNKIASYKIDQEYLTLKSTYYDTYNSIYIEDDMAGKTEEEINEIKENAIAQANSAVIKKYDEVKSSFLWIKNIWMPDTSSSIVLSYDEFIKQTGNKVDDVNKEEYEKIMAPVKEANKGWNGFYILIILSAVVTFLSMQVSVWMEKIKAKKANKVYTPPMGGGKVLTYVMPIIMAVFTLFYNAAFGLYIVAGAVFGLITSPLLTLLVDKVYSIKEKREQEKTKITYSRK